MSKRPRHPKKEIENALQYAESHGWIIEHSGGGHSWGSMKCPYNDSDCRNGDYCLVQIWSTPSVPEKHAKRLTSIVDKCTRRKQQEEDREQENE